MVAGVPSGDTTIAGTAMIAAGIAATVGFALGWYLRRVRLQYLDRKENERIFGDYEDLLEKPLRRRERVQ
jgi:hypothetical protein